MGQKTVVFHVILYEPEIPPNTGNVIRLCANTGTRLHLIHPLGFALDEPRVKRAGLDYHDLAHVVEYADLPSCLEQLGAVRVLALTTKAGRVYTEACFGDGDALLFGPETRGLPPEILESLPADHRLRVPMHGDSRSLNLSNTVAVVLYEALRQTGFPDLA